MSEEDDGVDTRKGCTDRQMSEAARRKAGTDWLALVNREGTIWSSTDCQRCAQQLGIPVARPASAKPLAREKSERREERPAQKPSGKEMSLSAAVQLYLMHFLRI